MHLALDCACGAARVRVSFWEDAARHAARPSASVEGDAQSTKRVLSPSVLILAIAIIAVGMLAAAKWHADVGSSQVVINGISAPPMPTLAVDVIGAGKALYAQYCAACHGARPEGQPEWRVPLENGLYPAPPHDETNHTWHHTDELLEEIVRNGGTRNKSAMPGFSAQLGSTEIQAILTYIKLRWGSEKQEYQWWITVAQ